jgi:putative membrane protein
MIDGSIPAWEELCCGEQRSPFVVLFFGASTEAFRHRNKGKIMTRKLILATGLAAAMAFSATAAVAQDKSADKDSVKFIKNAIEANYAEIDAGKLAQEKGSEAVKQYGAMLVKDHTESNDQAKQVASQLGVDPPTGAGVTQQATYLKWKVLSGDAFDRTFAKDMVKDHQADIKEFQTESQKSDPAGSFAQQTLPTLQNHLREAKTLVQQTQTTGSK